MNKKFLSVTLFSALMIGATGTFTSCKDYDDDIKNLQEQLDKKASLEELTAKVSTLETAINDAKTAANEAKDKAQEALDKAGSAEGGVSDDDLKALKKELQDQIDKLSSLEAVETKIADLKKSLESQFISDKELKELAKEVETLSTKVMAIIGHRLTSLTLIPTTHINGIPSIELLTLKYKPQVFKANVHETTTDGKHKTHPVLDHVAAANAEYLSISTEKNEVSFKMSPSIGVMKEDIELPMFECFKSQNITKAAPELSLNKPIQVVDYEVDGGILTVKYKKNVNENIGTTGSAHGSSKSETFWMASLKTPIAEKNFTDAEKEAGKDVYVSSEYSRIEESNVYPYLANAKVKFDGTTISTDFAEEKQGDLYVHYHDSLCLYRSGNEELVDVKQPFDKPLDLRTLVTVCYSYDEKDHSSHKKLEEYPDYGLEFRFALAKAKYLQGDRKTDEQEFGRILADGYTLKSEVYDVDLKDDEFSKTSIGREPIIRAELWDKNKGNMIAVRYIKVRWTGEKDQTIAAITFPNDTVTCKDMFQQLFSKEMNEKIYHMVKFDGGQSISKTQFHAIYKKIEIVELKKDKKVVDLTKLTIATDAGTYWNEGTTPQVKDGKEAIETVKVENKDITPDLVFGFLSDALDNTSYNLVWAMNPKTVGTLAYDAATKTYASEFEITVRYLDEAGLNGDVKQTFKQKIVVPEQKFAYQGTFWKGGTGAGVFNVNPIVYNTTDDGGTQKAPHVYPGTANGCSLKDYSHIEADLVNGFVYAGTKEKPKNLAQFIKYIRSCAEVKFIFDAERMKNAEKYPHLAKFKVSNDGEQLWKTTVGGALTDAEKDATTTEVNHNIGMSDKGIYDYIQTDNNLAATINNLMGASANENKTNLLWNYDETLGNTQDQCSSIIRLHETDKFHGTAAAQELIDTEVPVSLVVEYNDYNKIQVLDFDVFFIEPLKIDGTISDNFVDAEIDGSFLNVGKNFTFTDWNGYKVAAISGTTGNDVYAHPLYDYYGVDKVRFLTEDTKTSLTWNEETQTYEHKEGTTDGKMPTNASLKMMTWNENQAKSTATPAESNPTHLAYFNNHGTPVNVDYNLFVTVNVDYKWGSLDKENLKVLVKKAEGTPSTK